MNSDLYHTDDTSAQEPRYGRMNQQIQTVWRGGHGPTRRQLQYAGFQGREDDAQDLLPARLEHGRIDNRPPTTSLSADRPANLQHLSKYLGPRNSAPEQVSHHSHLSPANARKNYWKLETELQRLRLQASSDREEIEELGDQLAKSEYRGKALEAHLEECKDKNLQHAAPTNSPRHDNNGDV
jgi:hypothetical protein